MGDPPNQESSVRIVVLYPDQKFKNNRGDFLAPPVQELIELMAPKRKEIFTLLDEAVDSVTRSRVICGILCTQDSRYLGE